MLHDEMIKEVLFTEQQIAARVAEVGAEISHDYKGKDLLVIGVLKGAWVYLADLMRHIDNNAQVDFMSVSSYNGGTVSSGSLTVVKDLSVDCKGRHILIVEDIVDTGITLSRLKDMLLSRGAASVEITTLLSKPARRKIDVDVKYIGFEIPDKFVIGYGLDFDERYRGLPDVCVLDEKAYM